MVSAIRLVRIGCVKEEPSAPHARLVYIHLQISLDRYQPFENRVTAVSQRVNEI